MKSINRQSLKRLTIVFIAIVAVVTLASGCAGNSRNSRKNNPGKVESITVGMEATSVNSLIYIAESQKYFEANGLKVTIKDDYPSGAIAAEGMLKGEVDVATAAEFAIVRQAFVQQDIQTLGSIDMFMHMKLIGRKDLGIENISDLKGKRIGVPLKSAADFQLGRFLDLHDLDKNEISIVDVQAPQAVDALINGEVDAVVAWQPNVLALKDRLGDQANIWSVQSGQPMYCAVVTTGKLATENPEAIKRFLNALKQAEDYVIQNPGQGRAIVQKRLDYDDGYIKTIWPEHEFSLRLDQSFILAMEDQARWMIANNLTAEKSVPDFLDYIYEDAVMAVKPKSVNIIRAR
ncbi:MAG: hypothetical protein A2074_04280 [Candidatus Aquicultor primus]|uniref:Solute-binding protein family 3/N-terminal domain-containing protein n=1 Tax=Candidatus Aquicultor primus TaxID=1797195 RepID=A0A1F2UNY2_9ACTN|nr:MAG: hypothetical protein A2074_04280 [Candidatus Aquicultor primus]HCG99449.1 hypothetical protein [Actinomycetota bacterium]